MRITEGTQLRAELDSRRAQLGELFERAGHAAAAGAETLRGRLVDRVRELRADATVDEAAIAQEIVRFANRSDITEETVRFRAHLEHWRALSEAPEPCGRKLDFLLQEMNREVNTLGLEGGRAGVSEIVVAAEGRAGEDARAGAECRVAPPRRRGLLFVVSAPPAPERRRSSSAWSRFSRICHVALVHLPARRVTGERRGGL